MAPDMKGLDDIRFVPGAPAPARRAGTANASNLDPGHRSLFASLKRISVHLALWVGRRSLWRRRFMNP